MYLASSSLLYILFSLKSSIYALILSLESLLNDIKKRVSYIYPYEVNGVLAKIAASSTDEAELTAINMVELGQADTNGQSVIDCFVC